MDYAHRLHGTYFETVNKYPYFHTSPQRFTGGELKLYDTWVTDNHSMPAATYTTLTPLDNSIVFFRSDCFHEVSVRCGGRAKNSVTADSR